MPQNIEASDLELNKIFKDKWAALFGILCGLYGFCGSTSDPNCRPLQWHYHPNMRLLLRDSLGKKYHIYLPYWFRFYPKFLRFKTVLGKRTNIKSTLSMLAVERNLHPIKKHFYKYKTFHKLLKSNVQFFFWKLQTASMDSYKPMLWLSNFQ